MRRQFQAGDSGIGLTTLPLTLQGHFALIIAQRDIQLFLVTDSENMQIHVSMPHCFCVLRFMLPSLIQIRILVES